MTGPASLIEELDEIVQHGSPEWRMQALSRITRLFLDGADRFNEDHVQLFDDVLGRLVEEIEAKARAELAQQLAPVGNAPAEIVRRLAQDDDIAVAGPLLARSTRLRDADLVDIARTKSQAHLLAISGRAGVAEPVTDVLVRRGDQEVARRVAQNREARFSHGSLSALVSRAEQDGVLAERVAQRADVPPALFRELLLKATDLVQQRMLACARPEIQADIRRVLAKVSGEVASKVPVPDFPAAQRAVEELRSTGRLNEAALVQFAKSNRYGETIVALAEMSAIPIDIVDRLMGGERPDPIVIVCKSLGFAWPTVRAIIAARPGPRASSSQALDAAFANFERLSPATAQRVMRFWQARVPATSMR
jgi:uncharacterized protein (DUF2336 family)